MRASRAGTEGRQGAARRQASWSFILFLIGILGVVQQAQATTYTTSYGYDEAGNEVSQTDAAGHITRWQYDLNSDVAGRTLPDGRQETYKYDSVGNQVQHTSFDGQTTYYAFDVMNRVNLVAYPDGREVRYTYTPVGQIATIQAGTIAPTTQGFQATGTTKYTYDVMSRVSRVDYPNGVYIAYGYDNVGNLISRTTASGTTQFGYDPTHKLIQVIDPQGHQTNYVYDVVGRLSKTTYPNGVQSLREYDVNGHLIQIAWKNSQGQLLSGAVYTLLPNGQVQTVARFDGQSTLQVTTVPYTNPSTQATTQLEHWALGNPAAIVSYTYDYAKRLAEADDSDKRKNITRATTWTYDAAGNRTNQTKVTTSTDSSGSTVVTTETASYTYDTSDRLQAVTNTSTTGSTVTTQYTWDARGRLIRKAAPGLVTTYSWRSDDMLTGVQQGTDDAHLLPVASYSYDDEGNRIVRIAWVPDPSNPTSPTLIPQETDYLVDETFRYPEVIEEKQVTGTMVSRTQYTWGNGLISASMSNGNPAGPLWAYYSQDGHGSTTALSDAQGQPTAGYRYSAFGQAYGVAAGDTNTYRFAGEYADTVTGLQYNRLRWYDTEIGRFLSMDISAGDKRNPESLNHYAYAWNDAVNNSDPTGLTTMSDISAGEAGEGILESEAETDVVGETSGQVANRVGKEAEDVVEKAINKCLKDGLKPGENFRRLEKSDKIFTDSGLGALPDFLFKVGDKITYLEVKTKLPLKSQAEAFQRIAKQLQAAIDNESKIIGVSFNKLGTKAFENRSTKILQELSDGGPVSLVNGMLDLATYLGEFVDEECLKGQVGGI